MSPIKDALQAQIRINDALMERVVRLEAQVVTLSPRPRHEHHFASAGWAKDVTGVGRLVLFCPGCATTVRTTQENWP